MPPGLLLFLFVPKIMFYLRAVCQILGWDVLASLPYSLLIEPSWN